MSEWTKRSNVPTAASRFSDIWDGDGWQINKYAEYRPLPFILLDGVMPPSVPASSIVGSYATLEEAQAEAMSRGKPDWSEWISEYGDD